MRKQFGYLVMIWLSTVVLVLNVLRTVDMHSITGLFAGFGAIGMIGIALYWTLKLVRTGRIV